MNPARRRRNRCCASIFSLFPSIVAGPLDESILRRARDRGIIDVALHDIRDWAVDRHRTVDDTPTAAAPGW